MMLLSMSNCSLVHAPYADVNGVVACVSPAQIAIDPPWVVLKIYDLAMKLCCNTHLCTHCNC